MRRGGGGWRRGFAGLLDLSINGCKRLAFFQSGGQHLRKSWALRLNRGARTNCRTSGRGTIFLVIYGNRISPGAGFPAKRFIRKPCFAGQ